MDKLTRNVFMLFVIGMIILFATRLYGDVWQPINWAMMAIAAVSCLLVFRNFVFIFNFSYSLAAALNGALLAVTYPSLGAQLLGAAMIFYGVRLFVFTWRRTRSDSYRPRVENIEKTDAQLPFPVKVIFWVQCTFLYTFHLMVVWFAGVAGANNLWIYAGAIIIVAGTILEALADSHKQAAKSKAPDKWVRQGLYARWRHPNFSGEIVVQLGLVVAVIGAVQGSWGNYAAAVIAPAYIVFLMVRASGRADESLLERFGDDAEFKDYYENSGALVPR